MISVLKFLFNFLTFKHIAIAKKERDRLDKIYKATETHVPISERDYPFVYTEAFVIASYLVLMIYILFRFCLGVSDANRPGQCVVNSIGGFMIAPVYTVGCNIGKDRFNIRLN